MDGVGSGALPAAVVAFLTGLALIGTPATFRGLSISLLRLPIEACSLVLLKLILISNNDVLDVLHATTLVSLLLAFSEKIVELKIPIGSHPPFPHPHTTHLYSPSRLSLPNLEPPSSPQALRKRHLVCCSSIRPRPRTSSLLLPFDRPLRHIPS